MISGTVLEVLNTANPRLNLENQMHGSITKNSEYKEIAPENIEIWEDFAFQNIANAFGHLFDLEPVYSAADPDMRGSPTIIKIEAQIDMLAAEWNKAICRQPLKVAGAQVQDDLQQAPYEISLLYRFLNSKSADGKTLEPDWVICMHNNFQSPTVAVWGDCKCSGKWHSDITQMLERDKGNWIWPFRQLLTYCVNEDTRYGYIMTPEEIVLLRVFDADGSDERHHWGMQYHAIPWDQRSTDSPRGALTVNLGLWALAMCSINNLHRQICRREDTLSLAVWWEEVFPDQQRPRYRHHLSGRTVYDLPPGAISANPLEFVPAVRNLNGSREAGRRSSRRR